MEIRKFTSSVMVEIFKTLFCEISKFPKFATKGKKRIKNGVKYLPCEPTETEAPWPRTMGVHWRYITVTVAMTWIGNNKAARIEKSFEKKSFLSAKKIKNNTATSTKINHRGNCNVKFPKKPKIPIVRMEFKSPFCFASTSVFNRTWI